MPTINDLYTTDLEDTIRALLNKTGIPGCAITIVKAKEDGGWDEGVWTLGEAKKGVLVTPDTRFPLFSMVKLVTVLAVHQVLSETSYTFDTPLKTIIPEFKSPDKALEEGVTVADMCAHVSGLPAYFDVFHIGTSLEDILESVSKLHPTAPLRTTFQYGNLMFALLGLIIERISGLSYPDYVKEHILKPFDLDSAGFENDELTAEGHWIDASGGGEMRGIDNGVVRSPAAWPAGGLIMSIKDYAKYLKQLPSHPGYQFASTPNSSHPAFADLFHYPYSSTTPSYGGGLYQTTYKGMEVHEHWGAFTGYRGSMVYVPGKKVGLGVFVNGDGGELVSTLIKMTLLERLAGGTVGPEEWNTRIGEDFAKRVAKSTANFPSIPSPLSSQNQTPLVGTFTAPGYATWHLTPSNNLPTRPALTTTPILPQLWTNHVQPVFTAVEEGEYEGCFEVGLEGKVFYGAGFRAKVDGDKLLVYGLSGMGERVDVGEHPLVFYRESQEASEASKDTESLEGLVEMLEVN
ncbi:hypothetical protein L202_04486 [Cryptococcus amylolentus CBS 6039]|uniref:Beta-lactamase-related domain-containing protein n=1 Tax=Cryptococcus amylolentus CBS 6039 TaxID=1295533 RepID=A0A1E3HRI0_9TREE|nr:hypothetical protein L202_04486 [Cryptococcus amylolentus CBS 6039]ODN78973.1 hypothetical protein L202_04486 [Cryptococcus amylolentus CBS 6039]